MNDAATSLNTTATLKTTRSNASDDDETAATATRPDWWADRSVEVDAEGFLVDLDTGEVLRHERDGEQPFHVESAEAADWVLRLLAEEEVKIKAVDIRRAALLANLDSMLVDPRNRIAWLHRRFDPELIEQARRDITEAGGKGKTAKYPHGKVAFRTSKGSAEIIDAGAAITYVEEWAPEGVKKTVGVEAVRAAMAAEQRETEEEPDVGGFFKQAAPREGVSITTGIGIGKDTER